MFPIESFRGYNYVAKHLASHGFVVASVAWTALVPGCDLDVSTLDGVGPYQRLLFSNPGYLRSVITVWGANHKTGSRKIAHDGIFQTQLNGQRNVATGRPI
jgi:predicted dienelactone hydrolase